MQEILADHVTWALTHLMQYVQSSFIADLYPLLETLSFGWNDCDAMDWHDAYSRVKAVLPSYGDEKASKVLKQLWSRHMGSFVVHQKFANAIGMDADACDGHSDVAHIAFRRFVRSGEFEKYVACRDMVIGTTLVQACCRALKQEEANQCGRAAVVRKVKSGLNDMGLPTPYYIARVVNERIDVVGNQELELQASAAAAPRPAAAAAAAEAAAAAPRPESSAVHVHLQLAQTPIEAVATSATAATSAIAATSAAANPTPVATTPGSPATVATSAVESSTSAAESSATAAMSSAAKRRKLHVDTLLQAAATGSPTGPASKRFPVVPKTWS